MSGKMTVTLRLYNEQYKQAVDHYIIDEIQFTGEPCEAVELCERESDRHAILILYGKELIGFFVLHGWNGAKKYTENRQALLLRTFSIDSRYQGRGYAKAAMVQLDDFVCANFPDTDEIVLGVNHANHPAQSLYLRYGFSDTGRRVNGNHGEQYVYEKQVIKRRL